MKEEKLKQQQREYDAQMAFRAHAQEFIDKFRYNAKRASLVQSKIKMLEKLPTLIPVDPEARVVLRFPDCEKLNPPVLQLDDVPPPSLLSLLPVALTWPSLLGRVQVPGRRHALPFPQPQHRRRHGEPRLHRGRERRWYPVQTSCGCGLMR